VGRRPFAGACGGDVKRYSWAASAGELRMGPLAVSTLGRGRPVLLLHGLGGSHRYWGASYDALGEGARLVAPDLLGFGSSPRPASGYTADAHVDALVATLDWLGIDEPVLIGAHSIGSLVALALAARHPERVSGIVAAGPPFYPDPATARRFIGMCGWLNRQLAEGRPGAERACHLMCRHHRLVGTVARLTKRRTPLALLLDGMQHSWASYSETFASFIATAPSDAWLDAVRVPVCVLAGRDDPVLDHRHLEALARRHDHVALLSVAGADHDLPLTRPELVLREIRAAQLGADVRFTLLGPPGSGKGAPPRSLRDDR